MEEEFGNSNLGISPFPSRFYIENGFEFLVFCLEFD
jgi:hypothetical protein